MNNISGTQQAMIFLAIVMCVGFTGFTLFAIVPLVRMGKEMLGAIKSMMEVLQKSTESTISKISMISTESTESTKPPKSCITIKNEEFWPENMGENSIKFKDFVKNNKEFLDSLRGKEDEGNDCKSMKGESE